ncbi:unnamed protein product [Schistocephalus solidus]|uniref:Guanine nucleotide-binding protein subunit beta-like protein n=1 Tax=Schistocephalus solidus TaxID=70667 RepID=A0A183T618_SCHSO|nr:unnamed protein product [Schistocephalus solidus]
MRESLRWKKNFRALAVWIRDRTLFWTETAENYFTTLAPHSLLSPDLNAHLLSAEHLDTLRLKFIQSLSLRSFRSNALEANDDVCSADDTDEGSRGRTFGATNLGFTEAEQMKTQKIAPRRPGRLPSTPSSISQAPTQMAEDASDTDVRGRPDRFGGAGESQAQATAIPTLCFSPPVPVSSSMPANNPPDATFLAVYWSPDTRLFLYELRKDSQDKLVSAFNYSAYISTCSFATLPAPHELLDNIWDQKRPRDQLLALVGLTSGIVEVFEVLTGSHLACVNSTSGPVRSLDVVYAPQQQFVHIIGTFFVSRDEEDEGCLEEVEFFQFALRLSAIGSIRRTAQSTVSVV